MLGDLSSLPALPQAVAAHATDHSDDDQLFDGCDRSASATDLDSEGDNTQSSTFTKQKGKGRASGIHGLTQLTRSLSVQEPSKPNAVSTPVTVLVNFRSYSVQY